MCGICASKHLANVDKNTSASALGDEEPKWHDLFAEPFNLYMNKNSVLGYNYVWKLNAELAKCC